MSRRRTTVVILATILVLALSACAAKPFALRYEPSGAALTSKAAEELAATTDISALSKTTADEAVDLRAEVLAQLRAKDEAGARAADLLTQGFPERTAAVPVLVRLSSVDGTSAVVVVEAFGDDDGTLTHRRLWVFSLESGAVLRAASFR